MNQIRARNEMLIVLISLLIALILEILPLPHWLDHFRPDWVAMVLLYWVIITPHRINLGTAWVVGLLMDALQNTLLGEHAVALTVAAYLATKVHRQFQFYPLWQQAVTIMILVTIYQFIRFWIQGVMGQFAGGWTYWLPVLTSALFWPVVIHLLHKKHRGFEEY